ncbi:dTDP-4-dehydrorhamnose 3,5-epimerase family protein [Campylobacter sp. MIT 21-1685]|uniref:dTDP-4-dehydrorhamnose 3,5-epimerase family protein n=1 Tax=unclassified Campylobacter TaxID=2593542 RepID=UPI00224AF8FE|nr:MULTISPECIES: dTDP-4-dehydrorhamnose 3,5-epimerase family protein [unclassified Campylobacter]MCX2683310.1 dTDP-4-dehydrorhamnose 3,5-epimerase family protein [Campylobacter sp. MIT 21-1684]MCX2751634.1 dTDP-4-dehydrorhamnose 3,5-epimerase family protein [Campylobacter sp. MIT 21-1682]MCX2807834.1 dTDP-4-dehydrorhamnose 3,5-epimerase family protein [Campylobacter sp. MIT 21-1685]
MAMEFIINESKILQGVFVIEPNKFSDVRGDIWTAFTKEHLSTLIPSELEFKHDKFINSHRNVLRGIHGDYKTYKLVTCVYGEVRQVVVDARKDSPTYLQWQSWDISAKNQKLILLPPNMGNAHLVLSKEAVYYYKLAYEGEYLDAPEQFTLAYNDANIGVDWGIENPILSDRDKQALRTSSTKKDSNG